MIKYSEKRTNLTVSRCTIAALVSAQAGGQGEWGRWAVPVQRVHAREIHLPPMGLRKAPFQLAQVGRAGQTAGSGLACGGNVMAGRSMQSALPEGEVH